MAPDPRRSRSEQLSPINGDLLDTIPPDENDNSDGQGGTPEGYMLFTGGLDYPFEDYSEATDDDDDDDDENEDEGNVLEDDLEENIGESSEEMTIDCGSNSKLNVNSRPDIAIDCDKIKEAMVGFTLPASSIPAWASHLSDVDITSHISRILNQNDK